MSTRARKERKKQQRETGTKFQHPVRVGTPLEDREWFRRPRFNARGKRIFGFTAAQKRALIARDGKLPEVQAVAE